ncbi:CLUMA_CG000949, isoform A [Clunio marinus]|uniref:CLUMA_CG000949, isoform A n=1 Tax=Clunio marinus TaxID=568069 RepID=A0A1J1HIB0_9DIPT|nr:CLUMA_CG000949, isoform A [Clunio marinus]
MGRLKGRQQSPFSIKPSIYSKEDIIDQYCLTDRQLNNSIEAPRREKFFGCWSNRSQQSFLGVCVGRRAPSDENLQDYAPINRHPRYQKPTSYDDDDLDSTYFRRKPTSFLNSNDVKRYTWMVPDDESVRMEGSRPIHNGGPYVVGSYPPKSSFLSQSSEQITGYRCPAHINLPTTNSLTTHQDMPPRTKHVSFARSLTLASFDDAIGMRPGNQMFNARSQERLIGGKKPTITITQQPAHLQQMPMIQMQTILQKPQLQQTFSQPHLMQSQNQQSFEAYSVEKQKRNVMKTQATQTELFLGGKQNTSHTLSLSPRTIQRVIMVSQGAQTNGMNGKKLTKSFSEMGSGVDAGCQYEDERGPHDHEFLCRTQSEDSPKSPLDMSYIKPSSGYMMTTAEIHSRTSSRQSQLETSRSDTMSTDNFFIDSYHSHDSANTYRSPDTNFSKASYDNSSSLNSQDNLMISRRASHTLQTEPIFIGRNELEKMRVPRSGQNVYDFESHSLPRRTCIHHTSEEYHTHSLPRREHHHHYFHEHNDIKMSNGNIPEQMVPTDGKRRLSTSYQDAQSPYVNVNVVMPDTYSLSRNEEEEEGDEEGEEASGSETELDDEREEKEIFIDFKPRLSPTLSNVSTTKRKKKLTKAMSEGEILLDDAGKNTTQFPIHSASDEDLNQQPPPTYYSKKNLNYADTPIRDEDVFKVDNFLNMPPDVSATARRYSRETLRKSSVSLEDPLADDMIIKKSSLGLKANKSSPSSPGADDGRSLFASSDDVTRDHSEGHWNESQATVLPRPPSPPDFITSHLTPSTKRKHLIHQQRSSLDIEALDVEDMADQPLPPLPPIVQQPLISSQHKPHNELFLNSTVSTTTQTTCLSTIKPATSVSSTTTPTGVVKPTPSIAVTHTQSIEKEEKALINLVQRTKPTSPSKRKDIKKRLQHKGKHTALERIHRSNESLESSVKTSSESILNQGEVGRVDVSEGSTTEDYVTCTDNSRRMMHQQHVSGIRKASSAKGTLVSSTAQIPGAAQSSQTLTIDGSSFESASSFHSLARVDAICEDVDEKAKGSPTHSVSSTSSGSYGVPPLKVSSPRTSFSKPIQAISKTGKRESMSDDERSEKMFQTSHEGKDYKTMRIRRSRDWSEDERIRKKGNFKLEFDKDAAKAQSMSPFTRPSTTTKKVSPDDKALMNILDGTSPSKQHKRFRPKTRKTPRNRTPISSDEKIHRPKASKSPEKLQLPSKESPSKLMKPCMFAQPVQHQKKSSTVQRLKAISTESLRSVSPGSDSVFYSEADILEHQIHCHHCGKEVEVVTAVADGSEESVVIVDDGPDIVQPPEGFADSPNGLTKVPPALKYYKRFRAEDRRHKKGHNGRAKSEERGSDDQLRAKMRGAGSSPCMVPVGPFGHDHHGVDPEQGIYHGGYTMGAWLCIADRDVWRKFEVAQEVRFADTHKRNNSTDSEKDFCKKYQAITHRLVHRKSCVEMYRRQSSNSFDTDKHVIVQRISGEFGFRIHGSKPVVVSAIEKDTPAETSGLEVGDIVLSVNGVSVVDKSHSEVVKIAHAGSDTLELEVARTIGALSPVNEPSAMRVNPLYSGHLWRKSGQGENARWIRRWFCFHPDQCLYYYKSETDVQPLGVVLLTNHIVKTLPCDKTDRPFAFTIEFPESKSLHLSADNEESANRWVAIMSHAAEQNDPWLEMATRNMKLPPQSIARADCVGYLMKLGLRWRSWTKRYCVLRDACLYFYHESNSKSAIGMVCLQGYRVQPFATGGKKHAFELVPSEPKYRNYYFHTESEMDKKRWIAALEYSIDRWMKAN